MNAAPDVRLARLQVGVAVLLLAVGVALDPLGRLLVLPAGALVLVLALRDLLVRPVLSATPDGLTVLRGLRRVPVAWSEVVRLRVVTDRRARLLEIDLDDTVLVLTRRQLGAAPADVLDELEALRPPHDPAPV